MAKRANRADAIRKVQGLMAKAGDGNDNEHERAAAERMAIALRLKHGIGDDEMAAIEGETIEFMGMRFLFYGQRIAPLMDRIRSAVESAIAIIGPEAQDAVDLLENFRKDLKFQEEQVVKARDAIVKQRYHQKRAELYPNWDDEHDGPHAHNMTVRWMKGDLRKDQVERIVGISENVLWKKHVAWMDAQEAAKHEESADA